MCWLAIHRCILRARLPDGELFDTLVGKDVDSQDPSESRTVVVSQDVSWEALEAWLYGLYSGTLPAGEELKVLHGSMLRNMAQMDVQTAYHLEACLRLVIFSV